MNFLKLLVCAGLVASAVVISPIAGRAQSGPPPIPELMELLTGYLFQDTNFLSIWGDQPLSQTNLALVPTWDYYGLQVDASNAAWLSYPFESDGYPNTNNPTIDLFVAADSEGGIGYLTNSSTASSQVDSTFCPYMGRLGPGQSIQLNTSQFTNLWAGNHFIWCGVSNGSGNLLVTISDAYSNVLGEGGVNIQLQDIKQMYERWTVGDAPSLAPSNTAYLAQDNFTPGQPEIPFTYGTNTSTNTPYILYVHGWNMEVWDKDRFAESAFKRLYWQGYQGRFGVFRWPTGNGFAGTLTQLAVNPTEKDNYDSSEYQAWQSAAGLLNKLSGLNAQYPGKVYLLAHSMGNVVAGEALRLAGSTNVVNAYVASQAAITAHTYDSTVTNFSFSYIPFSLSPATPNIYGDWFADNNGGGAGQIMSFYNINDYALQRSAWQLDQLFKPDQAVPETGIFWDYGYSGSTNDPSPWNHFFKQNHFSHTTNTLDIVTVLPNRYEVMAYDAQPYTTALGATPGVLNLTRSVDLTTVWPSDTSGHNYTDHFWHSAEFRGDYYQQQFYWNELLSSSAFNLR